MTDLSKAVQFLCALNDGPWTLTAIHPDIAGTHTRTFTEPGEALDWLQERTDHNLYFQPNRMKVGTNLKGSIARLASLDCPHVDVDHYDGERLTDPDKKALIAARLIADGATFVIDLGNGIQGLFKLVSSLDPTQENIDRVSECNAGLIETYGKEDRGTWSPVQLMRLPFTTNYPDQRKRNKGLVVCQATLIAQQNTAFGLSELPRADIVHMSTASEPIEVIGIETIQDLKSFKLNDVTLNVIKHGAEPGADRSVSVFSACCSMVRANVPLGMIKGVLLDQTLGISESIYDQQRDADDYANRQVIRARDAVYAEVQAEFEPVEDEEIAAIENANRQEEAKRPRFKVYEFEELESMPDPEFLVEGLIAEGGLSLLYGPAKSLKTFVALDIVLRIATGMDYHGLKVKRGRVLYILGEGQFGLRKRVAAWLAENGKPDLRGWFKIVLDQPYLNKIMKGEDVELFYEAVRRFGPFDIIVVDTLNKCMAGDENSTAEMSNLVKGCEKLNRGLKSGSLVIHHSGHNTTRERGSSVLKAAVDCALRIKRIKARKRVELHAEAMRAGPDGWYMSFQVHQRDGSIVLRDGRKVEAVEDEPEADFKPTNADFTLVAIGSWPLDKPAPNAYRLGQANGWRSQRMSKDLKKLKADGLIQYDESGSITLTEAGGNRLDEIAPAVVSAASTHAD